MYLLGVGPELHNVKLKAQQLKTESVIFLGNVDNVQKYLWESDIYLHSAIYEPFGLVLIEAMAASLPVLTTNGKGNVDVMDQGLNGYILPEQTKIFCDKINEISNNKKLYSELANYCKKYSMKYDIHNYTNELIKYYKSIKSKSM